MKGGLWRKSKYIYHICVSTESQRSDVEDEEVPTAHLATQGKLYAEMRGVREARLPANTESTKIKNPGKKIAGQDFLPERAQRRPKVGEDSAQSQTKVSPTSAQGQPRVSPNSKSKGNRFDIWPSDKKS